METVSMHIDTVVLYVYQYCRSIDTGNVIIIDTGNVITIDTGNVITIHIKTADIVILVTISSHSYYLKTSQSTDGHVTSNYVLSHSILHAFSLNFLKFEFLEKFYMKVLRYINVTHFKAYNYIRCK